MSWFSIDSLYDYFVSNLINEQTITRFLTQYESQILKFEKLLAIPRKYDMLAHFASVAMALLIENYVAKDVSYLRALIYYFAIYSYVTAFMINRTIKDVSDLMQQLIEHAKSLQND